MMKIGEIYVILSTLLCSISYSFGGGLRTIADILKKRTDKWPKSTQKDLKEGKCTQNLKNIKLLSKPGFGDKANRYSFAMEVYKDKLYIGTSNIMKPVPGIYQFGAAAALKTKGTQIWSYDTKTGSKPEDWKMVISGGMTDESNLGVRNLKELNGILFGVTINHTKGFEVWVTQDGTNWSVIADGGMGDKHNTSGRGIALYKDYVYATTENRNTGAEIWRRKFSDIENALNNKDSDLKKGWEKVVSNGGKDSQNYWFSDLLEFEGKLYAGVMNNFKGMSLYCSEDGKQFEEIFSKGYGKKWNLAVMKLYAFKGELYFSTMNWVQGFSVFVMRPGQDGKPTFTEILKDGYNSTYNAYVWQFCEFNGRLYAGTYQNSVNALRLGMFSLYSTDNGRDWVVETDRAFGSSKRPWILCPEVGDYGIRTMKVHDNKMYIGTATAHNSCKVYSVESKLNQK